MNRRTFIAATGVGVGTAGCATTDGDPDDGAGNSDGGGDADGETDDSATGADGDADTGGTDHDDAAGSDASDSESDEHGDPDADGADGDGADDPDADVDDEADTDSAGRSITFHSCTRAEISGSFAADDVAFASTGFYDDGLYGNTILEDGVVFGDDVPAPFSGTVVFEVGDDRSVSADDDEIVVTVPEYGTDGTVITSLTSEREEYRMAGATAGNPHAEDCLAEMAPDAGITVATLETNAPVDAGDSLEASVQLENSGTTATTETVELVVGHEPTVVDTVSVTLEGGERTTYSLGYETPPVEHDQEFPVRVETGSDSATRTVTVYRTG